MKKVLFIVLGLIGVVVLVVVGFVIWVSASSNAAISETYDIAGHPVPVPTDSASIAQGKHIAITRGCVDCHGPDLGGSPMDMMPLGSFQATNLTTGKGGIAASYTDADWERSIRHGVKPDGSQTIGMPANEFYYLSDDDLGALIAYIKSVPPVDREGHFVKVGPVGRMLIATGQMKLFTPAKYIPHDAPRPEAPPLGETAAYGEYMAVTCTGCHGEQFQGGVTFGPDVPPSANLTPASMQNYDHDAFITAMRTGEKPDGSDINPFMPYRQFAMMTDTELNAIWLYLQQLPPVENEF